MTKRITIDKLAEMVQGGFNETHLRLEQFRAEVNRRFEDADQHFQALQNILDATAQTLKLMQEELRELKQSELQQIWERLERLEKKAGLR